MAWPDMAKPSTPGIKRNLNGDVMSVHGVFNYQSDSVERSLVCNGKIFTKRDLTGSDDQIHGAQWCSKEVIVQNARLQEPFSLDVQGFELQKSATAMGYEDFFQEEAIVQRYYPECAELVKSITGANFVAAFDHNVRSARGKETGQGIKGGSKVQGPAGLVHGDYTLTSGPRRFEQLGQAPKLNDRVKAGEPLVPQAILNAGKNGRFAIVNVWRNTREKPVQSLPLACCDASTSTGEDLCVFEIHYTDRIGENYFAAHSERHCWYYYPGMTRDEAMLIKQWDSAGNLSGGAKAPFALHAAFLDPCSPADAEDRESIEVRCICVFDKEPHAEAA